MKQILYRLLFILFCMIIFPVMILLIGISPLIWILTGISFDDMLSYIFDKFIYKVLNKLDQN